MIQQRNPHQQLIYFLIFSTLFFCSLPVQAEFAFVDKNQDLLADVPEDEKKWLDPEVLRVSILPQTIEQQLTNSEQGTSHNGPDVTHEKEKPIEISYTERVYLPLIEHLEAVTGKKAEYVRISSNTQQIFAMQTGKVHIAGFSTGTTVFAVNYAGYIPVAAKGKDNKIKGYHLQVITSAANDIHTLTELNGKNIAHVSPTSNSGNLAPRALLPELGMQPETDYKVVYSGSHRKSILGVVNGLYDGAAIASSVLYRMIKNGEINSTDIRILYTSPKFPTLSIGYIHNLHPELAAKVEKALTSYHLPKAFHSYHNGADSFIPISYKRDWKLVRFITKASGVQYTEEILRSMEQAEAGEGR